MKPEQAPPARASNSERHVTPPADPVAAKPDSPALAWAAYAGARLLELALIAIWLGFVFVAVGERSRAGYLRVWDLVAACYLVVGAAVVRHARYRQAGVGTARVAGWRGVLVSPRFNFACILGASLAGLSSAASVLYYGGSSTDTARITLVGSAAIFIAWMLLHSGYARFYAGLCHEAEPGGPPLQFPHCDRPGPVDFMYFAFTIGTSFAVSDVNVASPSMRWHVMAHSVLSFFYNAIVLALAVGILTGR
ncbi:MAG: DUF1345 domain-containing protein [Streptosporangiaceae bacterium]|jgi:uncharacterized membrane protein